MKKNVAAQKIGGQMVSATDGSAFTGAVTVYVCGDGGSQVVGTVGAGACTHEGNGYHTYAPDQAETNYDLIAFTFTGTGAVPATVQVFTDSQTGDSYAVVTNATYGLSALEALVDELETRLTAARAGYLDNLSGGAVALDSTVAKAATALSNLVWTDAKAGYLTGAVALEATLTAIKGAGWTTETLAAIDALLDAIKLKTDALNTAAVTVSSGISGSALTFYVGATWSEAITGLTIPSDWTKILFTVKKTDGDAESAALLQVQVSNPGVAADGLIRLNGAAPGTGEDAGASLTVNQVGGSVTPKLHQTPMAALMPRSCRWDLKVLTSDSPVEGTLLVAPSAAEIKWPVTRSTS